MLPMRFRSILACIFVLGVLLVAPAPLRAADVATVYPQVRGFFPEANRFGSLEGDPRAAPVFRDQRLLGYAFLTDDVVRIPGYSGKPINTLIGFDLSGRITGIAIVHHEEPILAVGITEGRLRAFTGQYRGKSVFDRISVGAEREGHVAIDTISGATITVMVHNATITRAARMVAASRGITPAPAPARGEQAPSDAAGAPIAAVPQPSSPGAPAAAGGEDSEPLWVTVWRRRVFDIAVLVSSLVLLTMILVFQDWFARRPRLVAWVRNAFLAFTVFFIGWYALGQLTVVNVLIFTNAVMREFRWEQFLIDPMLFILWSFVALTLLLWGRGVYCGWLCPFGALQEIVNKIAQRLKVRQFELPEVVHERLWAVKYLILIVLFGISLQSMGEAAVYAEVEPFKTTFGLRFQREWPFVLYAGLLIAITVVNRKFFCKYLCPLGAALSIAGRFRLFDWWLRRRKECGKPCQVCAVECPVRAIRATGEINANECHYCLDCQVVYYSNVKCPPLAERRKRRERRERPETVTFMERPTEPVSSGKPGPDPRSPAREL
ncbi:MAG: regulator of nitric oxide reductase transcription [Betaproteobacteria bacterium RIFCSPLOWO2_12_FULL_62_13]|nr:MAG: regulator of nitric oxide reductase transcription [Betaproteobacteria bacterium RIFCSPLOWO2_12_FULL_62_13]